MHAACGGRLMREDTLHITLAFLGDVPVARTTAAEAAAACVSGAPFVLELDRLGYWKHNRILWAGCAESPAALNRLAAQLAESLRAEGFALETRPFAAHATLLRNVDTVPPGPPPLAPIPWPIEDFVLAASKPGPGGSRYTVLRRWPLAAPIG